MAPMASGIIIVANNNNKKYCLCGITKNGKITDIGGKINKFEDIKSCAIREFNEETSGLYIQNLIKFKKDFKKNKINLIKLDKQYYSFILKGEYAENISNEYKLLFEKYSHANTKNGLYELKELKWFNLDYLYNLITNDKKKLYHRFYRILQALKKIN